MIVVCLEVHLFESFNPWRIVREHFRFSLICPLKGKKQGCAGIEIKIYEQALKIE